MSSRLISKLISLVATVIFSSQTIAASQLDPSFAKLDVSDAAARYFEISLNGDDLGIFWSRWSANEQDFYGDKSLLNLRTKCACSRDFKNYDSRFRYESKLHLANSVKVISTTSIPTSATGIILMDGIKATKLADVVIEIELVGESMGRGQFEWEFRLFPMKIERRNLKFAYIPKQPDPMGRAPLPGWYLLYKQADAMYISPKAVLAYYERQLVFLQNRATLGHDDDTHRAAKTLATKNLAQLASYLREK
jgi:hypothetical protein